MLTSTGGRNWRDWLLDELVKLLPAWALQPEDLNTDSIDPNGAPLTAPTTWLRLRLRLTTRLTLTLNLSPTLTRSPYSSGRGFYACA